jgi:hypothetical protein
MSKIQENVKLKIMPFLKNNGVLTIDVHHRWILIFIPLQL